MPTYEYECTNCGFRFEYFQIISAEPLKECQRCKGRLQRLIGTGSGVIFKGAGFYATDYRSPSYKEGQKKESKDKSVCDRPKTAECASCPAAKNRKGSL